MAKPRTVFVCLVCGQGSPQWGGRCSACGEWNTLVEEVEAASAATPSHPSMRARPQSIASVDSARFIAVPTAMPEIDRVLGGGFVSGSVSLLGGEPGIGKSTLLLQIAGANASRGQRVLYVSAEESLHQLQARAARTNVLHDQMWAVAEGDVRAIAQHIDEIEPAFVVVDSIQAVADPELSSTAGSVAQVRHCAHLLAGVAKSRDVALVLVGHVTKDGSLAGPRVLEHLVDTVLSFEGDRHHALRVLRAVKHRFGSTNELGVFEMQTHGLVAVPDPSRLFLADRADDIAGSVLVPVVDGHRPFLVEVQALVAQSNSSRRSAQGVDGGRLGFLLAVLRERAGVLLGERDVYALAVGGVDASEPGADLAVCLAVASAAAGVALPGTLAAYGEVGLGGELRRASHHEQRIGECLRLGIEGIVIPKHAPVLPRSIKSIRVATVGEAIERVGLGAS
jgi:DNA repair protein RadA/Sms